MDWTIEFDKKAQKQFTKLGNPVQKKIHAFLLKIAKHKNPRALGIALKGKLHLFWRYRVGDYRIICQIIDDEIVVLVVAIGHRKEIYE